MALRGNLRDFSLPDVFQLVTLSGKTGVLRIKRPDAEGSVWFRDGEIFFAQSDWQREPLGTRLVSAGKITPNALAKSLDVQKAEGESGRRLGQVLIDEGYLTSQLLEAFVQEQIQDTIFDLFRWDEGDFDFEPLDAGPEEDIGLSVSIENVVMEGSRRLEEWNRIKKKIPSMDIVFKMATAPGEGTFDISLKPAEWNLLLKVDGTRSVSQLARDFSRTDFEVARVIYGLFAAGLLEVASDEEVERLRAERAELEERYGEADSKQRAKDDAATDAALEREAQLAAEAETRARSESAKPEVPPVEEPSAEQPPAAEPAAAEAPEEAHVVDEPAFLGGTAEPAEQDMAVFEEMMGAVLQGAPKADVDATIASLEREAQLAAEAEARANGATEAPEAAAAQPAVQAVAGTPYVVEEFDESQPFVPAEAPAFEQPAEAPAVTAEAEEPARTGDFEADLMALGLGELPPEDLLAPEPGAGELPPGVGTGVSTDELTIAELEAMTAGGAEPTIAEIEAAAAASEPAAPEMIDTVIEPVSITGAAEADTEDLTSLLSSLEVETEEAAGVIDTSAVGFDLSEAGVSEAPEEGEATGGVISTDAFLADFSGGDASFSTGGMTDELTALTGGGRQRPQATAKKIPEDGDGAPAISRDSHVDRALVEKIIDGVKKL